jgi:hypothetical protein
VGITKMKVTKETSVMTSPPPAGDDGPRLNSRGLTRPLVLSTGMRAKMVMMQMQLRRKMHHMPLMDQC